MLSSASIQVEGSMSFLQNLGYMGGALRLTQYSFFNASQVLFYCIHFTRIYKTDCRTQFCTLLSCSRYRSPPSIHPSFAPCVHISLSCSWAKPDIGLLLISTRSDGNIQYVFQEKCFLLVALQPATVGVFASVWCKRILCHFLLKFLLFVPINGVFSVDLCRPNAFYFLRMIVRFTGQPSLLMRLAARPPWRIFSSRLAIRERISHSLVHSHFQLIGTPCTKRWWYVSQGGGYYCCLLALDLFTLTVGMTSRQQTLLAVTPF